MLRYLHILLALFSLCSPLNGVEPLPETPPQPAYEDIHSGKEEADRFTTELLNMVMTLLFFIGVILALSWFLKRILSARQQQVNTQSSIKILEQRNLSSKTFIYLLDVRGHTLVVAESPTSLSLLASLPTESPSQSLTTTHTPFEQILDRGKEIE